MLYGIFNKFLNFSKTKYISAELLNDYLKVVYHGSLSDNV